MEEIRKMLLNELGEAAFFFINTRLILNTGLNLNDVGPLSSDPNVVARVTDELKKMGFLKAAQGGTRHG